MLMAGLMDSLSYGAGMMSSGWSLTGWSLAMGQDSGDDNRLTMFVGIAAFSMLLQVLILMGVGIGSFVALRKLMVQIEEIKEKINPMVAKATELTSELTPKIRSITTRVDTITAHGAEISGIVREKVVELSPTVTKANETLLSANQTVMDATTKTHEQLLRVNEMISQTLDATERAGKRVVHNVTQPGREIAGIAKGVKVAVQTFFEQQGKPAAAGPVATPAYRPESDVPHSAGVAEALIRDKSNDIGL